MNDVDIGKRIKQYRKGKMTQKELAAKIQRTESSIRKYEKGLITIPLNILEEIASTLGVTAFDLTGAEYFDLKDPKAQQRLVEYEPFKSYLQSMGFSVQEIPDKGNNEEGVLSCSYAISGNGLDLTLSHEEYAQLQASSGDLIFSYLWKKKNKNKPLPAATENGK